MLHCKMIYLFSLAKLKSCHILKLISQDFIFKRNYAISGKIALELLLLSDTSVEIVKPWQRQLKMIRTGNFIYIENMSNFFFFFFF